MAIVNLGTRQLNIGGGMQTFNAYPFKDDKAYLIKGLFTISQINNIFSFVRIRGLITVPGQPSFWAPIVVDLDIIPVPFSFFYPFSPLYDGDGTVVFYGERLPIVPGAGEIGTVVTLNLFYDDNINVGSWYR